MTKNSYGMIGMEARLVGTRVTRNDLAVHTSHIYPRESNICEEKCPRIIVAASSIAAQNCISINREMVKFNMINLF